MSLKTFKKNNHLLKSKRGIEQPHSFHDVLAIRLLALTFSVSPLFSRESENWTFFLMGTGEEHPYWNLLTKNKSV